MKQKRTFKNRVGTATRAVGRLFVYGACGLATVFILANSYETAFGQDVPIITAVTRVNLQFLRPEVARFGNNPAAQTDQTLEGNYGAPLELKIADNKVRIPLAPPVFKHQTWLARSNAAHYIITTDAKEGNIGDVVVYMRQASTTIREPSQVEPGKNIFLDTKRDWRYLYRIDEVLTLRPDQPYLRPDSKPSRLFVVVQGEKATAVIAATLVNVQSAEQ